MATGFGRKYRFDPFFNTEVNIIALQSAFALFLLILVGIIATLLYHDAATALSQGITEALTPHTSPAAIGSSIVDELSYTRDRTVEVAVVAVVLVTLLMSYLIARLALAPTRNALKSQKQFIGNVAHELRTPLAIIKTNTEVALLSRNVEKEMRTTLESNVGELDRISEIINNLLSLSASIRPERIEFSEVELGAVVRDALQKLHSFSDQKHLEMIARLSERCFIWGNSTALGEIAMNIIKNAILYTPQGGRISVTVAPENGEYVEFLVQDTGRGIARKDLFRVFEPFYRADPSRKRGEGGSGLGLTIVSELVKLHNGKITVRSTEGHGTSVSVRLPASKSALSLEGIERRKPENQNEIAMDFTSRR